MTARVLVADDHRNWQDAIVDALNNDGIECHRATNKVEAIKALSNNHYIVVCLNWSLEDKNQGLELLQYIKDNHSGIRVILISASFQGDVDEILATCSNLKQQYTPIIETCFNKDVGEEWQQKLSGKIKLILDHPKLRWAHISDLHIESEDYHQGAILNELISDISGFTPLDFIVVSGDVTNSGNRTEFLKAKIFFNMLINDTGLEKKRMFLVPGNHDVNWNALDEIVNRGVQSFLISSQKLSTFFTSKNYQKMRGKVFERLSTYMHFVEDFFPDNPEKWLTTNRYFLNEILEKNGLGKISISSLNSAWSSAINFDYDKKKANDERHILVGEHQVDECIDFIKKEKCRLNICIVHHPKNWLSEFDRDRCWKRLESNFHLILHGHEHTIASDASLIRKAQTFGVGAVTQKDKTSGDDKYYNSDNRYHISEIDWTSGQGTQYLRRFSTELGRWIPDIETSADLRSEIPFSIKF